MKTCAIGWIQFVRTKLTSRPTTMNKESAEKAIREAYWQSWDKLPSVWVARDDDGSLWIYTTKPVKGGGMFSCSASGDMFQIDDSVYPEITFENSPVKVKLLFIDA